VQGWENISILDRIRDIYDLYVESMVAKILGRGCSIGMENSIYRSRDDRSSGCGIVVKKEWRCRVNQQ